MPNLEVEVTKSAKQEFKYNVPIGNVVTCKVTGKGLATKLDGALCLCKTPNDCCLKD